MPIQKPICMKKKSCCQSLLKRNYVINHLINHSGVTSPGTVCQGFFGKCYFIILLCTLSSGLYCPDTAWGLYGELPFVFLGGTAVHSDQISFGPLSHLKIHHRVNINGIPINARNHLCLADL